MNPFDAAPTPRAFATRRASESRQPRGEYPGRDRAPRRLRPYEPRTSGMNWLQVALRLGEVDEGAALEGYGPFPPQRDGETRGAER